MFVNKLKKDLKNGEVRVGTFVTLNSPEIIEMVALAGFDFVVIDTEHGFGSVERTVDLIRAAEAKNITPIIRVTENSRTLILRNLDVGAHGIIVPQVSSLTDANKLIAAAKYDPKGNRGVAYCRAGDYGQIDLMEYFEKENQETLIVPQCETVEGLSEIEDIAKIEDVDVIFFGPFDMSQSMGIIGKVKSEKVESAACKVLEACKSNGKEAGIFVPDANEAKKRIEQGFKFITIGMDCAIITETFRDIIKGI